MMGTELIKYAEKQAKERQKLSQGRGQKGKVILPDLNKKQATDEVAEKVGVK